MGNYCYGWISGQQGHSRVLCSILPYKENALKDNCLFFWITTLFMSFFCGSFHHFHLLHRQHSPSSFCYHLSFSPYWILPISHLLPLLPSWLCFVDYPPLFFLLCGCTSHCDIRMDHQQPTMAIQPMLVSCHVHFQLASPVSLPFFIIHMCQVPQLLYPKV